MKDLAKILAHDEARRYTFTRENPNVGDIVTIKSAEVGVVEITVEELDTEASKIPGDVKAIGRARFVSLLDAARSKGLDADAVKPLLVQSGLGDQEIAAFCEEL